MAASDTAVATLPASSPLISTLHEGSASNMSSPLSDVEDKDGDDDLMEQMMRKNITGIGHAVREARAQSEHGESVADDDDDDESNLSDVDINDSEAETERLHDSPHKPKDIGISSTPKADRGGKKFLNTRERDFHFSPSKLKQQTGVDGHSDDENDITSLSDKEQSDSDLSTPSSLSKNASGSSRDGKIAECAPVPGEISSILSAETRKRKRSPVAEAVENGQPVKKRVGSLVSGADATDEATGTATPTEETPANTLSGERSDDDSAPGARKSQVKTQVEDGAGGLKDPKSPARPKRNLTKKEKQTRGSEDGDLESTVNCPGDIPALTTEGASTGEAPGEGDADLDAEAANGDADMDADHDADAAHKDEEEVERRKVAQEFILGLEKSFAEFRDQYYEERIRLLNEEEAMLTAAEPTHPEYLAMMQCVDSRRDEKLRIIEAEYRLSQESLQRWAVAGRSQIMSQYYQDVRKTREAVLEELGDEWYRIQQQRRCHANNVADFSLRYPDSRAKAMNQAAAYNKEVSMLSEIARQTGFPGAPRISGASQAEIDDDLEEIAQARRASGRYSGVVVATFQDYGAIPNEKILGPAGEEFLKQTPWANPNHPSHMYSRPREQTYFGEPNGMHAVTFQPAPHGNNINHFGKRATLCNGPQAALGEVSSVSNMATKSGVAIK